MKRTVKKQTKKAPKAKAKTSNKLVFPMTTKIKMDGNRLAWPQ
jgi:hypothetical protein